MTKLAVAGIAAGALFAGSVVLGAAANADSGTVVRVVDGDTLIVSINNWNRTVRLLNIDTPETKDPNQPVECLGPEASAYLEDYLRPGTEVRLEFDVERHDQYGRTLAGVFAPDGTLVNAEIARRGLGTPVVFGHNRKFLPPVKAAYEESEVEQVGVFSTQVGCTLPAQLAGTMESLEAAVLTETPATSTGAGASATTLAAEIASAKSIRTVLASSRKAGNGVTAGISPVVTLTGLSALDSKISSAEKKADELEALERTLAAKEKKAEEERVDAEARAAAEREAAAAAGPARAAPAPGPAPAAPHVPQAPEPYIPPAPAPYVPPAPAPYVPPAPAPYEPPANPGYTGPRCYAPGGKTYRPC